MRSQPHNTSPETGEDAPDNQQEPARGGPRLRPHVAARQAVRGRAPALATRPAGAPRPAGACRPARIRPAALSDHDALCHLWQQGHELHARLVPDFFSAAPGPARTVDTLARQLADRSQLILVAEEDGALIGMVQVELYDTPPIPTMVRTRRAHVEDLVVDIAHRHRGLGRLLMDAAAAWAGSRGATQLVLTVWAGNEEAERFYHGLGYRRLSSVMGRDL